MPSDLHLDRPLVTVFGDHDALDVALNDELDRRGRCTHTITTPMGWLASVRNAVVRLNSAAGVQALEDLASRDLPATHVVAVCETSFEDLTPAEVDALCRRCGTTHAVTLIWHAPFELKVADAHEPAVGLPTLSPGELALTIADEVWQQEHRALRPSFASQSFHALT